MRTAKWEMTRGREKLDWKSSRYWWVMVWTKNGDRCEARGPFRVRDFDRMNMPVVMLPHGETIVPWARETDAVPRIGVYKVLEKHIWARMPAEDDPQAPNVHMEFDTLPWEPAPAE